MSSFRFPNSVSSENYDPNDQGWRIPSTSSDNSAIIAAIGKTSTDYKIKYSGFVFDTHIRREIGKYRISLGKSTPCIQVTVMDRDTDAMIASVQHQNDCGVAQQTPQTHGNALSANAYPFPRKEGTKAMVRCAVLATLEIFKDKIDTFSFTDTSFIQSNLDPAIRINLFTLHLIKHGATWYEQHMGATTDAEYMSLLKTKAMEARRKKLGDFALFFNRQVVPFLQSVDLSKVIAEKSPPILFNIIDGLIKTNPNIRDHRQTQTQSSSSRNSRNSRNTNTRIVKLTADLLLRRLLEPIYKNEWTIHDLILHIISIGGGDCYFLQGWVDSYLGGVLAWSPGIPWIISRDVAMSWQPSAVTISNND